MNTSICNKSNAELLSIILNIPQKNLQFHKLSEILTAPRAIKGIGEKRANQLYALQEISYRLLRKSTPQNDAIHGPEDAAKFLMPIMRYLTKEQFDIIVLDTKRHILALETISTGTLDESLVHPREVFQTVLKYPAAAIILCHNHPSGIPTPSREDIAVTERLANAGKILNIPVIDHVIIGDNRFISLKEKGLI